MNRYERLRFERGLTQSDVADRAGVSRGTIINIETGRTTPSAPIAKRLADFYGITVTELLGLEDEERAA